MKKLLLIIGREYFERVRNKSFIIVTLLMPLFMIGIMVAPSLMMLYGGKSEQKRVMVVDRSGMVVDKYVYLLESALPSFNSYVIRNCSAVSASLLFTAEL